MSQHDFTIGNQLFPATRTDLNNALVALASNSSGTTAPSTTYANQWWYETDTNTLKIRNEANSAWIEIAVLDQSANNVLSITTQGLTLAGTAITATGAELNKLAGATVTTAELNRLSGATATATELNKLAGATVTTAELNKLAGATVTTAELNKLAGATVTTAELNKLAGATVTATELNKLAGATVSTAELNKLDGITRGSIMYGSATGTALLPKGTSGQVLGATATDIAWVAAVDTNTDTVYTHPNHTGEVTSSGDGATVVASNVIDADNLNVTGNGTTSQFLRSDGDGSFTWATPVDTNTDTVYTHPNHSGEVTSTADGATVIASNVVDEANLKVSNAPVNGYVLTAQSGNTGGLTWAAAAAGGGGGVGVSQSWQTGTKDGQNTEGEPIMVFARFTGYGNTATFQVSSNNSTWITLESSAGYVDEGDSFAGSRVSVSAIIPDDHYWRITGTVPSGTSYGGPPIYLVLK